MMRLSPRAHESLCRRERVVKYIVAGGTAASVDIGSLYVIKGLLDVPLIPAVAISFLIAFCVSFILQKFWTFKDMSVDRVHTQAIQYFIVAAINFFLNIILMYGLVELAQVWYLGAKVIVSGAIAFSSFFVYRIFIFNSDQ